MYLFLPHSGVLHKTLERDMRRYGHTDLSIKKIREGVTEGRVGLSFVHESVDTVPASVTSDSMYY